MSWPSDGCGYPTLPDGRLLCATPQWPWQDWGLSSRRTCFEAAFGQLHISDPTRCLEGKSFWCVYLETTASNSDLPQRKISDLLILKTWYLACVVVIEKPSMHVESTMYRNFVGKGRVMYGHAMQCAICIYIPVNLSAYFSVNIYVYNVYIYIYEYISTIIKKKL